jgi:hypothetical protein
MLTNLDNSNPLSPKAVQTLLLAISVMDTWLAARAFGRRGILIENAGA